MEVDGTLRDSKLKTVSIGGLARPDGKIKNGFRGCIQVSADPSYVSLCGDS